MGQNLNRMICEKNKEIHTLFRKIKHPGLITSPLFFSAANTFWAFFLFVGGKTQKICIEKNKKYKYGKWILFEEIIRRPGDVLIPSPPPHYGSALVCSTDGKINANLTKMVRKLLSCFLMNCTDVTILPKTNTIQ